MIDQQRSVAKATGTIEDIQRDLQAVRDDLSRLTQQMTNLVSVTGRKALREVKEQISPLEDAVRERPFAALAVAVGLGFLFCESGSMAMPRPH